MSRGVKGGEGDLVWEPPALVARHPSADKMGVNSRIPGRPAAAESAEIRKNGEEG